MANETISGQVAQIVSDREIILNRGSQEGVKIGMHFKVLDPKTIDIEDPVSHEILGSISRIKIVVRAVDVADHITIARTFRSKEVNVGGNGVNVLGNLFTPPRVVEQVETLKRDGRYGAPIGLEDSVVGIGDPFESADPDEIEVARSVTTWRPTRPGETTD